MKLLLRNALAVLLGFIAGSVVNMILVNIGPTIVPLPEGADISTPEGLKASMKLFKPLNFLFPFLGHALGTLVGAICAAKLARSQPLGMALVVGAMFLLGGLMMIMMLGGPPWFVVLDLLGAYLPMGYLGGAIATRRKSAAIEPSAGQQ